MAQKEARDAFIKRIADLESEKASLQNRINELEWAAVLMQTSIKEMSDKWAEELRAGRGEEKDQ